MTDIVSNYGKKAEAWEFVVEIIPHIRSIQKSLQETGVIGESEFLSITMCPDGYLYASIGDTGWHIQKLEGEETENLGTCSRSPEKSQHSERREVMANNAADIDQYSGRDWRDNSCLHYFPRPDSGDCGDQRSQE